jgi:cytochrome c2
MRLSICGSWKGIISSLVLIVFGLITLSACANRFNADIAMASVVQKVPGGDVDRGKQAIINYGCGSCHTIAGVPGARGLVGPPLTGMGERAYVAGMLENTPANLVYWIMHPQEVVPGNAMPSLGVTQQDAEDIAAYLYQTR